LRIARGLFDDLTFDVRVRATRAHRSPMALRANLKGHLVARTSRVRRSAEDPACHQQKRVVVVEGFVGVPPNFPERLAESRENVGRNLETKDVSSCERVAGVIRVGSRTIARNESLDLARRSTLCAREPLGFGSGRRYPRDLARRRPTELAKSNGTSEHRELFECFGDAKPFGCPA